MSIFLFMEDFFRGKYLNKSLEEGRRVYEN
jgi:hypothetical protein